ncbi:dehydrogenase/reductase [Dendryphion nanum]|uniref:Dehydrogenase/reductase n=1 Tax=Dendryphion nanum TaxID=256645 RepID=A0A9P9IY93_9PLEO|nr:dehydrogenase/reductase [Dendryphion nanum]
MVQYTTSVLITGGTQGLGYFCAQTIAQQHPQILVVVSSRTDPDRAAATINRTLKQSNVKFVSLDLGTREKVRSFVEIWKQGDYPPIEALVLNAGIQFPGETEWGDDGIEKTFAVNHVGHALLFHLLTPYMQPNARIVLTSSGIHDPAVSKTFGFNPKWPDVHAIARPDPAFQKELAGRDRYAVSKVANVLWTYALARRLTAQGQGKTVVAMNPGLMPGTNLGRNAGTIAFFLFVHVLPHFVGLMRLLLGTKDVHLPKDSGKRLAWLAMDEEARKKTATYYDGITEVASGVNTIDEKRQEELWEWTVEFVGKSGEERERFERLE